jgi:hypothetical protein
MNLTPLDSDRGQYGLIEPIAADLFQAAGFSPRDFELTSVQINRREPRF